MELYKASMTGDGFIHMHVACHTAEMALSRPATVLKILFIIDTDIVVVVVRYCRKLFIPPPSRCLYSAFLFRFLPSFYLVEVKTNFLKFAL